MASGSRSLELFDIIQPNLLAREIANTYQEWEMYRNQWLAEKKEIHHYLFATDTRGTTNEQLPWKNTTHIPKLCQIRDNLHANYMAALFPNDRVIAWEGDDESSDAKTKRQAIEAYISNKCRIGGFVTEVSRNVLDWIDYGMCFAMTEFVDEQTEDPITGETIRGFVGPRTVRVSPLDIVFNPTAATFEDSPKIIRSLKSMGSLHADVNDHPEMGYLSSVFDTIVDYRGRFQAMSAGDFAKNESFQIEGFGSWMDYFQGNYVELLDFYGDFYDRRDGKFYKNYIITVVDRCHIIRMQPNPSWLGKANIFACGWRLRPDNLYAMGPLDNLIGMQYRIDHLENAKADAFDLINFPVIKVKGEVEDFVYGPSERIFCGDEGDVEFMRTDLQGVLQADTQVATYEMKMEEMAGAPKQAMGFRTPGEKTAYEVQVLENGSNRVFLNKTAYLEENFLEKILNSMLELSRRNMGVSDVIRVMDDQFGVAGFMTVTRDDIVASGKLRPVGARRYARNANIVQNLTQLASSTIGQDPAVNVHISGYKLAQTIEELLGLERYQLVQKDIRIMEQMETQQTSGAAQQILGEQTAATGGGAPQPQQGAPGASPMVQPPQK